MQSEEAKYEFGPQNQMLFISPFRKGFKIFNPNRIFVFQPTDRIVLTAKGSHASFKFRNRSFAGDIILLGNGENSVLLIDKVNLEEYLRGVVPSEIPSKTDKYFDAVKAQAICARTYALKEMLVNKDRPFDVFADERHQVYLGQSGQTELADKAISQTRGDVLMYHDTLATIFYHSTCGGMLESARDVWANADEPYLQASKDALGKEFACAPSPFYRWSKEFSLRQIDSLFIQKYRISFFKNTVRDSIQIKMKVKVLNRSPRGRVNKMQLAYGDTTITLSGYPIRQFFSKSKSGGLPSTLFNISMKDDSVLVINGAGFGHGVGLCQWGALHMSELGFKYYDILVNKYFKGTFLKKVY